MRVGSGLDVHAFAEDAARPLVLAGVTVPGGPGLAGHSDADVVAHAVTDALLGGLALGDLGTRFGTAEPELAGADSMALLREVVAEARDHGWVLGNADVTVVAQRPRLTAYREAMRGHLGGALQAEPGRVAVKLTTTDGLGAVGRGEGVACWAVVLLAGAGDDGAPR